METRIKLFIVAFFHVALISANTYFIAQVLYPAIFICSFLISIVWSWNVKKISTGNFKDRTLYSIGASLGGVVGVVISKLFFYAI